MLFAILAVIYHGLGELLIQAFPGEDSYRPLIQDAADLHEFVLLVSIAIFLFAVTYTLVMSRVRPRSSEEIKLDRKDVVRFYDWRIIAVLTIPFIVLTARGAGYIANGATTGPNGAVSTSAGLSLQFMMLLVPLAGFLIASRFQHKRPNIVLVSALAVGTTFALVGQRLEILAGLLCLFWILRRYHIRLSRRAFVIGVLCIGFLGLVVTSARANEGRSIFATGSGSHQRITGLLQSVTSIGSAADRAQIRHDLGYRLDGNSWGALVIEQLNAGQQPAGTESIANHVGDAIPSFLFRSKDTQSVQTLYEQSYQGAKMNLPVDYNGNVIGATPTQLGTLLGYWGPIGLLLGSAVMGLGYGVLDRWLVRGGGPVRLLVGLGFVECVAFFERSNQNYFEVLRGVVVVGGAILFIRFIQRTTSQRSQTASQNRSRSPRNGAIISAALVEARSCMAER